MAQAFSKFLAALRQRESGGDYQAENRFGYLGAYQFGELALIDLGYYTRDGTSANDWRAGSFTGKNGIRSKADFLKSPAVQDEAAREWIGLLWTYIRRLDLETYDQQTLNGVKLTKSGMIAAAHLTGVGGLRDFLTSGGTDAAHDGNGVSLVDYIKNFAGYDMPSTFVDNLEKDNVVEGGAGPDGLNGFAGDDTLKAGPGGDALWGGSGADLLRGGTGGDALKGGGGGDRIKGGPGDDRLVGGPGHDKLKGGAGDDTLVAGPGRDVLLGGPGADTFLFRKPPVADADMRFRDIEAADRIDATALDIRAVIASGRIDLTDTTPEPDGLYLIAGDVAVSARPGPGRRATKDIDDWLGTDGDWLLVEHRGGVLTLRATLHGAITEDHFLV